MSELTQHSWAENGGAVVAQEDGTHFYGNCDLDWTIKKSPLYYHPEQVANMKYAHRFALYHSETSQPLGIVSNRFNVVQPQQVIQTFEHMARTQDMTIKFAGSADSCRKLWGLAKTGKTMRVHGNDPVDLYLMFATACDGTMSTIGIFTTLRVACMNMLNMVNDQNLTRVRIPHNQQFDPEQFSRDLEPGFQVWNEYEDQAQALAEREVTAEEVAKFLVNTMGNPKLPLDSEDQPNRRGMRQVLQLFQGEGKGAGTRSTANTAWGLVQAVTEYNDYHRKARSPETRFSSAAFGIGARQKSAAWTEAVRLVA